MAKSKNVWGTALPIGVTNNPFLNHFTRDFPICYQIDREIAEKWCTKHPDLTIPDDPHTLIGIQFAFKKDGDFLPQLTVRQVYIDTSIGSLKVADAEHPVCKQPEKVFQMHSPSPLPTNTHLKVLPNHVISTHELFRKLEYFPSHTDDIDFVFFPIDEIKYIHRFYYDIYLSGCEIEFGAKPSSDSIGAKHATNRMFSLKLEGKPLIANSAARLDSDEDEVELEDTMVSGAFIGAPCPPTWYIQDQVIIQAPDSIFDESFPHRLANLRLSTHQMTALGISYPRSNNIGS